MSPSSLLRIAIYARVSTRDKDQNLETQLLPLREFAAAQAWSIVGEFVDQASAVDLKARIAWRNLLEGASRRHFDLVLIWRIDRAFRSVLDAATTLEWFRAWGIGLRSYGEPWLDTTSPFGEALYYITAAYAQLERGILSERVRAGMERAKRQGKRIGRPGGTKATDFATKWQELEPQLRAGRMNQSEAARQLSVGRATIGRLLKNDCPPAQTVQGSWDEQRPRHERSGSDLARDQNILRRSRGWNACVLRRHSGESAQTDRVTRLSGDCGCPGGGISSLPGCK